MGKTDFDPKQATTRLDALDEFKKEFEGDKFYDKIVDALMKSRPVEAEIKKIAWQTIREKIVWIILGGVAVIFADLFMRAIPNILKAISGS